MRPYLVSEVRAPGGGTVQKTQPVQAGTLPVSPANLQPLIEGMKLVNGPNGTSDFAQWPLPGIATAGKTGTAENPPQDDYGLYVTFAPADKPEIAVAVVIEQAGHGGSVSPVARSIYAQYFGVKLPGGDPARIPDDFEP
jgi:penicillin-binding protein 2